MPSGKIAFNIGVATFLLDTFLSISMKSDNLQVIYMNTCSWCGDSVMVCEKVVCMTAPHVMHTTFSTSAHFSCELLHIHTLIMHSPSP